MTAAEARAWLLILHAGATLYMAGVIWFVQIVHYPLFSRVGQPGPWLASSDEHLDLAGSGPSPARSGIDAAAHVRLTRTNLGLGGGVDGAKRHRARAGRCVSLSRPDEQALTLVHDPVERTTVIPEANTKKPPVTRPSRTPG